jgi:hypothetical protein
LQRVSPGWDELIQPGDVDFVQSGLHKMSVIRLSYLPGVIPREVLGVIGQIDQARLDRLRQRISNHLRP